MTYAAALAFLVALQLSAQIDGRPVAEIVETGFHFRQPAALFMDRP